MDADWRGSPCKTCHGQGVVLDPSSTISISDCPDCIGKGVCPRCGENLAHPRAFTCQNSDSPSRVGIGPFTLAPLNCRGAYAYPMGQSSKLFGTDFGRTASQVAERAPCNVLVVRGERPARRA